MLVPKFISIILISFIIVAIISIAFDPITGYEMSIYSSLFPVTIIFIILPIMGGIGLVIFGVDKNNNYWQLGLLLILLINLVIVLLPYLKGYLFSDGGDHLSHLGFAMDITNTGHFSVDDLYPVTHILTAQLSIILGITPGELINYLGPLFYLLFVLFTYICAKEILSKSAAILATVASTILFCYHYNEVFPMGFALVFFPLVFYLFFRNLKTRSAGITILLILLIVLMVFFHPVTSFLLTAALLLMEFGNLVNARFFIKNKIIDSESPGQKPEFNSSLPLISTFCLMLWIWYSFNIWNSAVLTVLNWFNSELFVQPMVDVANESFNKLGLDTSQQLFLLMKMFGHVLVFLVLSMISVLLIIRRGFIFGRENNRAIFIYSCFFLPVVAIWLFDTVKPLTELSSGRMIWVVIAIFPILTGFALDKLGGTSKNSNLILDTFPVSKLSRSMIARAVSVGLIIVFCSLIGIFSLYPSPYLYQPSRCVSHSSFAGEAWLVQTGNSKFNMLNLGTPPPGRIAVALWGTIGINYLKLDTRGLIPHFGYQEHQMLGQSYSEDKYLFLVSSNMLLYTELWPQVGKFDLIDFGKLLSDASVNRIYDNGEAHNYYIVGQSQIQ